MVVDAQNSYSNGLSDTVERILRTAGLTVRRESVSEANTTDFSSLIARIPRDTQVIYIPWQLAPKAQLFGTLRASGRAATLFGSDGLFDPDSFRIPNSRVSFFPYDTQSRVLRDYRRSHGGKSDAFGSPTYVAMQVVTLAVDKACRNNQATRAEVRRFIGQTNIPKAQSLLGFRIRFFRNQTGRPAWAPVTCRTRRTSGSTGSPTPARTSASTGRSTATVRNVRPILGWAARRL